VASAEFRPDPIMTIMTQSCPHRHPAEAVLVRVVTFS